MVDVIVYTNGYVPQDLLDEQTTGLKYTLTRCENDKLCGIPLPVFVVYGVPLDEKHFRMWLKEV